MLTLVFLSALAALASAQAPYKSLPIFEPTAAIQDTPLGTTRSACVENCHHHILDKPTFVMARGADNKFIVAYAPLGLNALAKSPLTASFHQTMLAGRMVAVVFPFDKFPYELFPEVQNAPAIVPEHRALFADMYNEAPMMVIFSEDEFAKLNLGKAYTQIAEMAVSDQGYTVAKDLALVNRVLPPALAKTSAVSPLVHLVAPQTYPASFISNTPDLGRAVIIPSVHDNIPIALIAKRPNNQLIG